jgi:hypothetical protein
MYWLLGRKSKLFTNNKLLLYQAILKPIWTYGIQLWGTASTSDIEILKRFQPKASCRRRLSEGFPKDQQLEKQSAAAALNTELASAHTQTA